jgi:hypothetical protein
MSLATENHMHLSRNRSQVLPGPGMNGEPNHERVNDVMQPELSTMSQIS